MSQGSSSGDAQAFSSIEIKNLLEAGEEDQVFSFAGLSSDLESIEFLSYLGNNWDQIRKNSEDSDLPADFQESKLARALIRNNSTKLLSKALEEGNISILKRFAGKKPTKSYGGLKTYEALKDRLENNIVFYVFGGMGLGKTDFSLKLAEIWKNRDPDKRILSNIRSFEEKDELVEDWDQLLESIEEDPGLQKLFIMDEASNHLTGHIDQNKAVKLAKKIKKFRKYGAKALFIGHTGKDIHPELRKLATTNIGDVIQKKDLDQAVFYESIKGGNFSNKIFELNDIPKTKFNFDTDEVTNWSWGSLIRENEEKNEDQISKKEKISKIIEKMKEEGLSSYFKSYKSKDGRKLNVPKVTKDFDISRERAYELREELRDRSDIDFN